MFKRVQSAFGIQIEVDTLIDDIDTREYDALAIPGGFKEYGFYDEAYHKRTLQLIQLFYEEHKPIATVCVAAFPLAKSGILVGKRATTYHLEGGVKRSELKKFGVVLGNEWIENEDNIITSSCPRTAVDAAFELLRILTTEEKKLQVKKAMGYEA